MESVLKVLTGLLIITKLWSFAERQITKSKTPATAQLKQACVKTRA